MFGSKDSTCPFFAFFSLAEILDAASPDGIVVSTIYSISILCVIASLLQDLWETEKEVRSQAL